MASDPELGSRVELGAPAAFGDGAWRFPRPPDVDAAALLAALRARPAVEDVVVTEDHVCVCFDPERPPPELAGVEVAPAAAAPPPPLVISVRYDGQDLDAVAAAAGLTRDQAIALHAGREYAVALIGFLPGFAYLGPVDARLALPRRAAPRPRVPPGAVALGGGYTAVYPFASPGGWHLIGTAVAFVPFAAATGSALRLGQRVRFAPC
jgi:5-oxoprolinase (ATP-hydrolysing) subunit A